MDDQTSIEDYKKQIHRLERELRHSKALSDQRLEQLQIKYDDLKAKFVASKVAYRELLTSINELSSSNQTGLLRQMKSELGNLRSESEFGNRAFRDQLSDLTIIVAGICKAFDRVSAESVPAIFSPDTLRKRRVASKGSEKSMKFICARCLREELEFPDGPHLSADRSIDREFLAQPSGNRLNLHKNSFSKKKESLNVNEPRENGERPKNPDLEAERPPKTDHGLLNGPSALAASLFGTPKGQTSELASEKQAARNPSRSLLKQFEVIGANESPFPRSSEPPILEEPLWASQMGYSMQPRDSEACFDRPRYTEGSVLSHVRGDHGEWASEKRGCSTDRGTRRAENERGDRVEEAGGEREAFSDEASRIAECIQSGDSSYSNIKKQIIQGVFFREDENELEDEIEEVPKRGFKKSYFEREYSNGKLSKTRVPQDEAVEAEERDSEGSSLAKERRDGSISAEVVDQRDFSKKKLKRGPDGGQEAGDSAGAEQEVKAKSVPASDHKRNGSKKERLRADVEEERNSALKNRNAGETNSEFGGKTRQARRTGAAPSLPGCFDSERIFDSQENQKFRDRSYSLEAPNSEEVCPPDQVQDPEEIFYSRELRNPAKMISPLKDLSTSQAANDSTFLPLNPPTYQHLNPSILQQNPQIRESRGSNFGQQITYREESIQEIPLASQFINPPTFHIPPHKANIPDVVCHQELEEISGLVCSLDEDKVAELKTKYSIKRELSEVKPSAPQSSNVLLLERLSAEAAAENHAAPRLSNRPSAELKEEVPGRFFSFAEDNASAFAEFSKLFFRPNTCPQDHETSIISDRRSQSSNRKISSASPEAEQSLADSAQHDSPLIVSDGLGSDETCKKSEKKKIGNVFAPFSQSFGPGHDVSQLAARDFSRKEDPSCFQSRPGKDSQKVSVNEHFKRVSYDDVSKSAEELKEGVRNTLVDESLENVSEIRKKEEKSPVKSKEKVATGRSIDRENLVEKAPAPESKPKSVSKSLSMKKPTQPASSHTTQKITQEDAPFTGQDYSLNITIDPPPSFEPNPSSSQNFFDLPLFSSEPKKKIPHDLVSQPDSKLIDESFYLQEVCYPSQQSLPSNSGENKAEASKATQKENCVENQHRSLKDTPSSSFQSKGTHSEKSPFKNQEGGHQGEPARQEIHGGEAYPRIIKKELVKFSQIGAILAARR